MFWGLKSKIFILSLLFSFLLLILPNDFIDSKIVISSLPELNFISLFVVLHSFIFSFIVFIFLISFSILIQSLIKDFISLLLSHSLSINFPFSKDILILFGNFSVSFIISSLKYNFSNLLSTSNNNSSSLLLIAFH